MPEDQDTKIESVAPLSEEAKIEKRMRNHQYRNIAGWDGTFTLVGEIRDLIPSFKEFYYEKKLELPKYSVVSILADFNERIKDTGRRFYPHENQYKTWRRKWDVDILSRIANAGRELAKPEVVAVRTRDEQGLMVAPSETEIESGAKTLAGELMNDAMTMLKRDQESGDDLYDDEVLIKRRHYVLNVFNYVMGAVHRKEALAIKRSQEKRETLGFVMDLLRRSTAGKITDQEMSVIKSVVPAAPQPTPTQ